MAETASFIKKKPVQARMGRTVEGHVHQTAIRLAGETMARGAARDKNVAGWTSSAG